VKKSEKKNDPETEVRSEQLDPENWQGKGLEVLGVVKK
jgi:hypothetical protein